MIDEFVSLECEYRKGFFTYRRHHRRLEMAGGKQSRNVIDWMNESFVRQESHEWKF